MDWSFTAVGPVKAQVEVPAGQVDLLSCEEEGAIRVSLEPLGVGSERANDLIEASTVSFDDGLLRVHVPQRTFRNTELRCTLVIPERSAVNAKTASADVESRLTVGDLTVAVASGDVSLTRVEGELEVVTASGDVSCEEVTGRLRVKGASSDVTVGVAGGPVEIALASGDISLREAMSSVKVATASGDLEVRCAHEGKISAKSASGDIAVGVAQGARAYLDVSSITGDMECDLPMQESVEGEAELTISCQTMSGDVRIFSAFATTGRAGHD